MTQRILIMGLPGAGKTTLAKELIKHLSASPRTVKWLNADEVRKTYNDWDFSTEGRIRQSKRMRELADLSTNDFVVVDFVAPLEEMRNNFAADWTIWVDTIDAGRYEDTNKAFIPPTKYDFRVPEQDAIKWADYIWPWILDDIHRPVFDWKKETALLLGRYQPWHDGHRALFEKAICKTGQVIIQIRDCNGWNDSNPFAIAEVKSRIRKDLDPLYQGKYEIQVVPNITEIVYGRDVGYKITQEILSDAIQQISGTAIRKSMGI